MSALKSAQRAAGRIVGNPLVVFAISATFLIAVVAGTVGYVVAATNTFPAPLINRAVDMTGRFLKTGVFAPENLITPMAPNAPNERIVFHDPNRAPRGYRAIMGYDLEDDVYKVWLLDPEGEESHAWSVAAPGKTSADVGLDRKLPHGLVVLPDGSIVITGVGESQIMARYDRCSNEAWLKQEFYHHLATLDDEGGIWTWLGVDGPYSQDQDIVRLDAMSGEILERISLIDDIVRPHQDNRVLMNLPSYFHEGEPRQGERRGHDFFHTNDVEPLPAALAPAFPQFDAGDLLVSLRNLDMVAVIDRETGRIKWRAQGPFVEQHDPDFIADGRISVFNNNFGRMQYQRRSNLVVLDPESGDIEIRLDGNVPAFNSDRMGQHQYIGDDIVHIAVPGEGRVLEYDLNTGELVFEFNNRAVNGHNGHVANSVWLPEEYFYEDPTTYVCDS